MTPAAIRQQHQLLLHVVDGEEHVVSTLPVWQDGLPDLYRVPRYDVGFTLSGDMARNTLAEICALDVRPEIIGNGVLMTLVAGISVTLTQEDDTYRIWCDATYGEYLQHTLQELMD